MRQMPSVTETTVPMSRASLAAANFSMRWRMRSLISDALMDMDRSLSFSARNLRGELRQAALHTAVDHQIVGLQHGTAQQRRINSSMQTHIAREALAQRRGEALALLGRQLHRWAQCDIEHALVLGAHFRKQLRNLRQKPKSAIRGQHGQQLAHIAVERLAADARDEFDQLLGRDARIAEQRLDARIGADRGGYR